MKGLICFLRDTYLAAFIWESSYEFNIKETHFLSLFWRLKIDWYRQTKVYEKSICKIRLLIDWTTTLFIVIIKIVNGENGLDFCYKNLSQESFKVISNSLYFVFVGVLK